MQYSSSAVRYIRVDAIVRQQGRVKEAYAYEFRTY